MDWSAIWHWIKGWQWGSVVAWVAAVPAMISAATAVRQAKKSTAAARDAEEALALVLRPILAISGVQAWNEDKISQLLIDAHNMSAYQAVDVVIQVTSQRGELVGERSVIRMPGRVPGTLVGESDVLLTIDLSKCRINSDDEFRIVVTSRYSDEKGLRRWEQRSTVSWRPRRPLSSEGEQSWAIDAVDQGFPVPYFEQKGNN